MISQLNDNNYIFCLEMSILRILGTLLLPHILYLRQRYFRHKHPGDKCFSLDMSVLRLYMVRDA